LISKDNFAPMQEEGASVHCLLSRTSLFLE
jgi:hypothetical protein